jgi:hypothetical protein
MRHTHTTAALAVLTCAGLAHADHISMFSATISSGDQQVTPSGSPAIGTLTGEYDSDLNMFSFSWEISDDLIGVPSSPGAHLHNAPSGTAGDIVYAFNEPDGTWALSGSAVWTGLSQDLVDELFAGNIYANFHTDAFPAGEVRGQISQIPAPGALALLGLGGLTGVRRRR